MEFHYWLKFGLMSKLYDPDHVTCFMWLLFDIVLIFSAAIRSINSCDGSVKSGSFVSVDMKKIGRPCTCTVNALFVGDLLVTSFKVNSSLCNTRVRVNSTVIFNCYYVGSYTFKVLVNRAVIVKVEHISGNNKDSFNHCVGFSENGNSIQKSMYWIN